MRLFFRLLKARWARLPVAVALALEFPSSMQERVAPLHHCRSSLRAPRAHETATAARVHEPATRLPESRPLMSESDAALQCRRALLHAAHSRQAENAAREYQVQALIGESDAALQCRRAPLHTAHSRE